MKNAGIALSSLILFFIIVMPVALNAESNTIRWQSYHAGVEIAEKQNLPVFLHFYADWCPYCFKMEKETFQEMPVIRFLNSHFVSIKVDFDKDLKLVEKYQVRGLPSTFVIDMDGKRSGPIQGYLSGQTLLKRLNSILREIQKSSQN